MKASTVLGWHRKGFRLFWTWKIRRGKLGRPTVPKEVRDLIRTMSRENPLWRAARIHGELLKLGIEVGETRASKYMVRGRRPLVPDVEDFPQESREEFGICRLFRYADDPVPDPVCVSGAGA